MSVKINNAESLSLSLAHSYTQLQHIFGICQLTTATTHEDNQHQNSYPGFPEPSAHTEVSWTTFRRSWLTWVSLTSTGLSSPEIRLKLQPLLMSDFCPSVVYLQQRAQNGMYRNLFIKLLFAHKFSVWNLISLSVRNGKTSAFPKQFCRARISPSKRVRLKQWGVLMTQISISIFS